jgi:hypothetical protein
MPANSFHCPGCKVLLKSSTPVPPGKKIKCPKCGAVFGIKIKSGTGAATQDPPRPQAASSLPVAEPLPDDDNWEVLDEDLSEEEEESGPVGVRRRRADEDLDEEQDEDLPRVRRRRSAAGDVPAARRRRVDVDDDLEDEEPDDDWEEDDEPPRRRKPAGAGGNVVLVILIATLATVLAAAGGIGGTVWWYINRDKNRGTGKELPMAYIPADTDFVVGVDFAALMSHPAIVAKLEEAARRDVQGNFLEDCKKETGLEMQELFAHVIVAVHMDPTRVGAPPFHTIIAQSSRPFNQNRVRDSAKEPRAHRLQGKTYFQVQEQGFNFLYMPSDRILVMSSLPEAQFQTLLSSNGTETSFSSTALDMVSNAEQKLAWLVAPVSARLKNGLAELGKNPVAAQQVPPQVNEALAGSRAFGLWAEMNGDQLKCTFGVACADNDTAEKLVKAIQPTIAQAKGPGAVMAMAFLPRSIQSLAKEVTDSLAFSTRGHLAQMSFRVNTQTVETLVNDPQVQAMGNMARGGMQPGGPGPGGIPGGRGGMPGGRMGRGGGMAPRMGGRGGRPQGPGGGGI